MKLEQNCLLFNYNYILWAKKFNKWQENGDGGEEKVHKTIL